MAASAMVAVGSVDHIIKKLVEESKKIVPGKNLGAVITKQAKERIERYITEAEQQGAKVLLDGRNAKQRRISQHGIADDCDRRRVRRARFHVVKGRGFL